MFRVRADRCPAPEVCVLAGAAQDAAGERQHGSRASIERVVIAAVASVRWRRIGVGGACVVDCAIAGAAPAWEPSRACMAAVLGLSRDVVTGIAENACVFRSDGLGATTVWRASISGPATSQRWRRSRPGRVVWNVG